MIDAGIAVPAEPIRLKKVPDIFRHLFFHITIMCILVVK